MTSAPEPPQLQAWDIPAAWLTMSYASAYSVLHSRAVIILSGLIVGFGVLAVIGGGWRAAAPALVVLGAYLAACTALVVVVPPILLLVHMHAPNRRVWALPGARAVVTARRTERGWNPDNASARPIGSGAATALFTAICDYADNAGVVIHSHAGNLKLATHYINHYGGTMHRTRLGRIQVERLPAEERHQKAG